MVEQKRTGLNWGFWARLAVTLSILGVLGYMVRNEWDNLVGQLRNADVGWLAASLCTMGVVYLVLALRWQIFLLIQGIRMPYRETFNLLMIGNFFNAFLPGSSGGDVIRIYYAVKAAPDKKTAAAMSVILDRVLGLVVLLIWLCVSLPWQVKVMSQHPQVMTATMTLMAVLLVLLAGSFLLVFWPVGWVPAFCREIWSKVPKRDWLELFLQTVRAHGKRKRLTLLALLVAIAGHWLNFVAVFWIVRAMNLPIEFGQTVIIMAFVFCAMALPASISGHGIREGALAIMFGLFSVGSPKVSALAFSILLLLITWLWSLVGGVIYLVYLNRKKRENLEMAA
jgi:uncharacterized protein (TIRG00374 family)